MECEGLQGASLGERANRLTAAGFDKVHEATAKSTLLREFAALAYGNEYPAEVAPTGMTTWWILGRCIAGLRVGPGEQLVDLGCGSGAPGLWLARASGADLVGVDWSPVAVEAARHRAADFLPDGRARFVVGELADSGLLTDEADAVLCLDAVFFAPDRVAALREVCRLLRPGGRYVFSATEVDSPPDRSWVTDWQPLLAAADLEIECKDEVPHYAERLQRMYDLWLENLEALEAEVGFDTAAKLEQEARAVGQTLQQRRQFLIVARPRLP
jgi:SAM-dependent methyltransferase